MKVLFDHPTPFLLAHGGFQIQIEQTKAGLEEAGITIEHLRWWDEQQRGDVVHYFGRPSSEYIRFAQQKNFKVVIAPLLTGLGSRSKMARLMQRLVIRGFEAALPRMLVEPFNWNAFRMADGCIALTAWEAQLMEEMFEADPKKIYVLPNAVEPIFLEKPTEPRGQWLVCTATITQRKRVLELSEAAVKARVPLWVIGKPYSDSDAYAKQYFELARKHPEFLRYEGAIQDRFRLARIYQQARGFVLLSTMETRSLSAEEAAGCGCPLLLSDLPWAKSVYGNQASYCPISVADETGKILKRFYDEALRLPIPAKPKSWGEVGQQLKNIYEAILKTSS